jgi:hypothetical protein
VKAKALEALPREMRDAIFEQLYVQALPIKITWSRIGDNFVFQMPKDEALYLSEWHVGFQIAMEAADIFYKYNIFALKSESPLHGFWNGNYKVITEERTEQWFDTDHYGSGVTPRGIVRKVDLHLCPANQYHLEANRYDSANTARIRDHANFESLFDENRVSHNMFDHRAQLDYLSKVAGLHEIRIIAQYQPGYCDQLNRLISPYVRRIKANGTKVVVQYSPGWDDSTFNKGKQITHFFDEPSVNDYKILEETIGRPKLPNPSERKDPMLAWWDFAQHKTDYASYDNKTVDSHFVRVWLQEHFEFYTFYQNNKILMQELDKIKANVEWQDARTKAIELRYFNRVVELVNPELATPSAQAYRASGNPWG